MRDHRNEGFESFAATVRRALQKTKWGVLSLGVIANWRVFLPGKRPEPRLPGREEIRRGRKIVTGGLVAYLIVLGHRILLVHAAGAASGNSAAIVVHVLTGSSNARTNL